MDISGAINPSKRALLSPLPLHAPRLRVASLLSRVPSLLSAAAAGKSSSSSQEEDKMRCEDYDRRSLVRVFDLVRGQLQD
jgi:hypothetical protein